MASANDYFKKTGSPGNATTLAAPGHTIGGTSFTVDATSLWPTDTGVTFAIDTVTVAGGETRVPGTYTVWDGVVSSGTTITSAVLRYGSDQNYSAGSTTRVYILPTSTRENKLIDGLLVQHNQNGTHGAITATSATLSGNLSVTGTSTLSGAVTLPDNTITPSKLSTNLQGGWENGLLPSVSSVTANGNRSYDVVFASTVASYLTPGMRLRTTRTVAAPTQCTSLNGTTQYYSKASPNKLTFTDDFVVSAWVKLTSYGTASGIVSRYNGTSGFLLFVDTTGQVVFRGANAAPGNYREIRSYQSLPLNKWVYVAAQLDMSAYTATTTTCYLMFDGVDIPGLLGQSGTNPTAIVQAGSLEVGTFNGTGFFPGKIAQVAIYNAKVTQAVIKASMNQTLTGSETSLASAYSFNGIKTDLNTSTPNDLTANGSAVETNADSPFSVDANGTPGGSYDFATVRSVTTTTAVVQTCESNTIPTSGGVSAVDLSTSHSPLGFPGGSNILGSTLLCASNTTTATTPTQLLGATITVQVPTGGRKVEISISGGNLAENSASKNLYWYIYKGTVGSGTIITGTQFTQLTANYACPTTLIGEDYPASGSITYNIGWNTDTPATATWGANTTQPTRFSVKLV